MPGEDQLLADDAVHLHAERLVRDDDADAPLVRQRDGRDRFLVQRGDDRAEHALGETRFRVRDPEPQLLERLEHPVRRHLVGVADAGAKLPVGRDDRHEGLVDGRHRRRARPLRGVVAIGDGAEGRLGHDRQRYVAVGERVVALARASADVVVREGGARRLELAGRHPETAGVLVEAGCALRGDARVQAEREIVRVAAEVGADLIVIGARHRGAPVAGPASVGPVARYVLDHARSDVLLLRGERPAPS